MADEYTTPDATVSAPVETAAPVEAPVEAPAAPAAPTTSTSGYNPATSAFDLPSA